jgi:hypothetical protein
LPTRSRDSQASGELLTPKSSRRHGTQLKGSAFFRSREMRRSEQTHVSSPLPQPLVCRGHPRRVSGSGRDRPSARLFLFLRSPWTGRQSCVAPTVLPYSTRCTGTVAPLKPSSIVRPAGNGEDLRRCHSRSERRGWRGFWHVSMSGLPISALEMPPAARMATRGGGRHRPKCPVEHPRTPAQRQERLFGRRLVPVCRAIFSILKTASGLRTSAAIFCQTILPPDVKLRR